LRPSVPATTFRPIHPVPAAPESPRVPDTTSSPGVGVPAPDFTLPSTAGVDVTLSSFRGKQNVLLAFFPLAFTSTCTAENCAFTEDYEQFAGADTVVLPISVDSVPTLKEYRAKYEMRQDLLSDFKRDVCRRYGTLLDDKFFSSRAYYLIDKGGVIRWAHTEAKLGDRRDDAELLRVIRSL
jgi:peroxiredoxin